MFSISFGEISIVILAAALLFGTEELKALLKLFKKTQHEVNKYKENFDKEIKEVTEDLASDLDESKSNKAELQEVKMITDLEGNLRRVYSLEEVEAKLKENSESSESNLQESQNAKGAK